MDCHYAAHSVREREREREKRGVVSWLTCGVLCAVFYVYGVLAMCLRVLLYQSLVLFLTLVSFSFLPNVPYWYPIVIVAQIVTQIVTQAYVSSCGSWTVGALKHSATLAKLCKYTAGDAAPIVAAITRTCSVKSTGQVVV